MPEWIIIVVGAVCGTLGYAWGATYSRRHAKRSKLDVEADATEEETNTTNGHPYRTAAEQSKPEPLPEPEPEPTLMDVLEKVSLGAWSKHAIYSDCFEHNKFLLRDNSLVRDDVELPVDVDRVANLYCKIEYYNKQRVEKAALKAAWKALKG